MELTWFERGFNYEEIGRVQVEAVVFGLAE